MPWLSIAVIVYGIAVAAGGVMGKVMANSNMSLLTGGLTGVLIIIAGVVAKDHPRAGYGGAAALAIALTAFFGYKFATDPAHKPMPAMGVIGLSVVMLILLVVGHFMAPSTATR